MDFEREVRYDNKPNTRITVHIDENESPREDEEILDITKPFPDLPGQPEESAQFTIRALIVGTLLGAVVSASNMYLCLKTGWTFGASLFGTSGQSSPFRSTADNFSRSNPRIRHSQASQQLPTQILRRRLLRPSRKCRRSISSNRSRKPFDSLRRSNSSNVPLESHVTFPQRRFLEVDHFHRSVCFLRLFLWSCASKILYH